MADLLRLLAQLEHCPCGLDYYGNSLYLCCCCCFVLFCFPLLFFIKGVGVGNIYILNTSFYWLEYRMQLHKVVV